jgi:DNA polymerase III subunit delta'
MRGVRSAEPLEVLPGVEAHPHARAVLGRALSSSGSPSHAYLFHGPTGSGKREVARGFASALLADGAEDPAAVAARVARGSHPDLIWVRPSGAAEMLVSDIEEPVVAGATRTPFESSRRVFVIEAVHTMNDQAANRMLKTLEEPPSFVHLILLAERREDVLPTIASRCQPVRFDPLTSELIQERLQARGVSAGTAAACARLALGNAELAEWLADEEGQQLRSDAESFVRLALRGATAKRPWMALLDAAKAVGERAAEDVKAKVAGELEFLPRKEHRRHQREGTEAERRAERRTRTLTLDRGLRLAELWLRDLWCQSQQTPELIYALDRRQELENDGAHADPVRLRAGIELVTDTRLRLALNISEELALEALAYRLESLFATVAS